jgi:hypothetical protein
MLSSNYTFLVGAPGSRWSGIGQIITDNFDYNNSDESLDRVYSHGSFSGHKGSYFGPGMENGNDFHRLEQSYIDRYRFGRMCDSPFSDKTSDKTKMIKCHQFAYGLDWLKENVPHSNILLIKRGSDDSFDWWKEAGGWDITYPDYSWYIDDVHMRHYIDTEIKLANLFVQKTGNEWVKFDKEWIENNFGTLTSTVSVNYEDVEVCLIRTNV